MGILWMEKLEEFIEQGYIRVQKHPSRDLKIYNYTTKTQIEGFWNEVTLACRGLVLDSKGGIVLECPKKFFNYNEPQAAYVDLDKAVITEKLDGYYISARKDEEYGLILTSRGSFNNQYVEAAKELLGGKRLIENYSYFFELCQNFDGDETIIVTQHETPKLLLWGLRNQYNTWLWGDGECDRWDCARTFTIGQARKYLNGQVEGVVAFDPTCGERVKIKTEWFINMHRIVSDCSKKRVWEILKNGQRLEDFNFPDEILPTMKVWAEELRKDYAFMVSEVRFQLDRLKIGNPILSKKDIALDVGLSPEMKRYLFEAVSGKWGKVSSKIWKNLKPVDN